MAYVFNPITGKLDDTGTPQVNSDWNATSGVEEILNKPTIQTFDQSLNTTDDVSFNSVIATDLVLANKLRGGTTSNIGGEEAFLIKKEQNANATGAAAVIEHVWDNTTSGVPKALVIEVTGQAVNGNATLFEANYLGVRKFAVDKNGFLISGQVGDNSLSNNVPLKNTANTFTADQTFSGTANTAPNQTAASGSSIMTRDLVDQRMIFGGPFISPLATSGYNTPTASGGAVNNSISVIGAGNGATPIAGSAAAVTQTTNQGYQFISPDNGIGAVSATAGNGGVINFTQPFALGFFIEIRGGPTNALDVISRVSLGGVTITAAVMGVINNAGFGVRISRATSTTYDVAIYARTIATTNTNITAATNATPIVVTNTGHNLQNGDLVEITGVLGNTAANGIRTVANRTANTFELSGIAGNGVYISGGVANKISPPIQIPAGRVRRMFLYNRGNGTLELHLGSITNTPAITLTGMSVYSGTQLPTQSAPFSLSQQSVTDATAFAGTYVSNMMLIQP